MNYASIESLGKFLSMEYPVYELSGAVYEKSLRPIFLINHIILKKSHTYTLAG